MAVALDGEIHRPPPLHSIPSPSSPFPPANLNIAHLRSDRLFEDFPCHLETEEGKKGEGLRLLNLAADRSGSKRIEADWSWFKSIFYTTLAESHRLESQWLRHWLNAGQSQTWWDVINIIGLVNPKEIPKVGGGAQSPHLILQFWQQSDFCDLCGWLCGIKSAMEGGEGGGGGREGGGLQLCGFSASFGLHSQTD